MNRRRLDAESLRDSVLLLAGKLDRKMGGPSVKQFVETPGIHVTPKVDYEAFDIDRPEQHRRGVYRFVFRTLPDPFLEALDCPDAAQLTPVRTTSMSALQALALLHDRFMVRMSEHVARGPKQPQRSEPANSSNLPLGAAASRRHVKSRMGLRDKTRIGQRLPDAAELQ